MPLTDQEIMDFRKALDESARPLFFFDDDPDGACAFVLLYKYKGDGKGVIVKATPELREEYVRRVEEYQPDLIVILDKPIVSQDFLDKVKCKVIWLDHHPPLQRKNVTYYNPRLHDDLDNRPTTYWAYKVADRKEDEWIALLGCISDWFYPEFTPAFSREHEDLIPASITTADDVLFETTFGKLVRILSFNLKLTVTDAMKAVKILSRISSPDEILSKTTAQGRYLHKAYEKLSKSYTHLLSQVHVTKDPVLFFSYSDDQYALTNDLSNELIHRHPEKLVIIAREKGGILRISLRSTTVQLPPLLKEAFSVTRDGSGGGHTFACGANVRVEDKDAFLLKIREYVKTNNP